MVESPDSSAAASKESSLQMQVYVHVSSLINSLFNLGILVIDNIYIRHG